MNLEVCAGRFEKVSFEQWREDLQIFDETMLGTWRISYDFASEDMAEDLYNRIKLPRRATDGSAGYDFYLPFPYLIADTHGICFPTGIKWVGAKNCVLLLVPRSSVGIRFGLRLTNTIGVIDSDYCEAENEGHIKCVFDSKPADNHFTFGRDEKYMQGIIVPFLRTENDWPKSNKRVGGIGSTGR